MAVLVVWRGGGVVPDRLLVDLGNDGQATVQVWPDGGLPEEVSRAPVGWPLDAGDGEDLRWYLENYLLAPFGVWEERGPAVRGKLAGWGKQVFEALFGRGPARDAYQRARDRGLEVVFRSSDPGLLGLPWVPPSWPGPRPEPAVRGRGRAGRPRHRAAPGPVPGPGLTRQPDRGHRHLGLDHLQRPAPADPDPPPDSIARQARITLRDQDTALPPGTDRITEVVATKITRHAKPPE